MYSHSYRTKFEILRILQLISYAQVIKRPARSDSRAPISSLGSVNGHNKDANVFLSSQYIFFVLFCLTKAIFDHSLSRASLVSNLDLYESNVKMSYYPKGSRSKSTRATRVSKRKFKGNQFTDKESASTGQSASTKKLATARSEDIVYNPVHCYRIIEFLTVFSTLSEILICRECKQNVKFEEAGNRGLGFKLVVTCRCSRKYINSGPFINNGYEINQRIVFVMRLLGVGIEGINLFCGLMDLGQGLSLNAYYSIVEKIHNVAKLVFDVLCQKAVKEEKEENVKNGRSPMNLKISGDGSWKKRGFTSLYGVTTLIGYYSGKVIDLIVKGSYCQACTIWSKRRGTEEYAAWYETHEEECASNHIGSAGKMEVDSVLEMFSKSEDKYEVKYGNYIGDGDSKTYKAILDLNPYGEDFPVVKSECIGHVEKRMGSRLRNIKTKEKLGGKGKLTAVLIKKLTKYYGLAIRRNIESVDEMAKAIMATYYHLCSTNEKPRHENCPPGPDSWCKYRVAEVSDINFDHPPALHPDVAKHLLPIYEELSKKDLLERCLGGHTQNANESFNSTIWRLAPKHLNSGIKIIEIAAFLAAGIFNEGYYAVLKIMEMLNIKIGQQCKLCADTHDATRVTRQERRSLSSTKEARMARRQEQIEQNEFYEEAEGLLYGPGIAD